MLSFFIFSDFFFQFSIIAKLLNICLTVISQQTQTICTNRPTLTLEMKWNESGFRPPLCTYRLNWAKRTSWGWGDEWDDTVLQTQDSKFEHWQSEAEHATSRSRRLPTILTFTRGVGRNIFVSLKPPRPGTEPRTLAWKAAVLTTTLGPPLSLTLGQHCTNNLQMFCVFWVDRLIKMD